MKASPLNKTQYTSRQGTSSGSNVQTNNYGSNGVPMNSTRKAIQGMKMHI
jgi:hypothetical protein